MHSPVIAKCREVLSTIQTNLLYASINQTPLDQSQRAAIYQIATEILQKVDDLVENDPNNLGKKELKILATNVYSQVIKQFAPDHSFFFENCSLSLEDKDELSNILEPWVTNVPQSCKIGYQKAAQSIRQFLVNSSNTKLDLSHLDLKELPSELCQFLAKTQLKELDLEGNYLTSVPHEMNFLKQLEKLNLNSNKLSSLPHEIGFLNNLKELNLEGNQLEYLPPEIGFLTNLKELYLDDNQLTALPYTISSLTQLEQLFLCNNQLTWVPATINSLTKLVFLDLSYNPLKFLPEEILQLPAGSQINLICCPLSVTFRKIFQEMTSKASYQGPRCVYSIPQEWKREEKSLEELFQELSQIASHKDNWIALLEKEFQEDNVFKHNLTSFLSGLSYTADYISNNEKRTQLANKIISYLHLAIQNRDFLNRFKMLLTNHKEPNNADRITLVFLKLGIEYQFFMFVKKNFASLANFMIKGYLATQLLHSVANAKIQQLSFVDEAEVHLAYLIYLKIRLQLPFDVGSMRYFACSGVSAKDLETAASYVKNILQNEEVVNDFLLTQDTWIKALKEHAFQEYNAIEEQIENLVNQGFSTDFTMKKKMDLLKELTKIKRQGL